jgi:hypothetical protein
MVARIQDGSFVSAIRVLPGFSKDNKLPVGDGQFIFYDNVLLEMNIKPAKTLREFLAAFANCYDFTQRYLAKKGYCLIQQASQTFPKQECEDVEACIFGCDPEYCIYNRTGDGKIMRIDPPVLREGNTFRSCGGHVHIGHLIATVEHGNPARVVKLMDGFVGSTALLLDRDQTSQARRKLYGGAGTHRVSDYGLEYRTLSNFWYATPTLTGIIYGLTRHVIQQALTNPDVIDKLIDGKDLQKIINDGNIKDAAELYKKVSKFLPMDLQESIDFWQFEGELSGDLNHTWSRVKRDAA